MTNRFYWNVEEGNGYLSYQDGPDLCVDESRLATDEEKTLQAMADGFDQDAESANSHKFVGVHRALACLLGATCGMEKARAVFLRLEDYGGLHGVREGRSVERFKEEFGVDIRSWRPWELLNGEA